MKNIIRAQYRAAIKDDGGDSSLREGFAACRKILEGKQSAGALYTAALNVNDARKALQRKGLSGHRVFWVAPWLL